MEKCASIECLEIRLKLEWIVSLILAEIWVCDIWDREMLCDLVVHVVLLDYEMLARKSNIKRILPTNHVYAGNTIAATLFLCVKMPCCSVFCMCRYVYICIV